MSEAKSGEPTFLERWNDELTATIEASRAGDVGATERLDQHVANITKIIEDAVAKLDPDKVPPELQRYIKKEGAE